jgi:peptidoglycan/LPS O-acetylase OafA/YrhL
MASDMRIQALDGWRGIAILMVLVTHSFQWALSGPPFEPVYLLGKHGVAIFFVLSGFLITRNLHSHRIDLKRFYKRRFFRLMPSAWVFLLFASALCVMHSETPLSFRFLGSFLFFRNYVVDSPSLASSLTGHFWSLSIEEQFYLVWPLSLALIGVRRGLWLSLAGFLASSVLVFRFWSYYAQGMNGHRTGAVIHALLCGCFLALVMERDAVREWIANHANALMWVGAPVFALHVLLAPMVLLPPTESISIAAMLAATVVRPLRILEWEPLAYVGRISYSLYVWQAFFLMPHAGWLGILLVLPAGAVAHMLIETPGMSVPSRALAYERGH